MLVILLVVQEETFISEQILVLESVHCQYCISQGHMDAITFQDTLFGVLWTDAIV